MTAAVTATVVGTDTGLRIEGRVDFDNAEKLCADGLAALALRSGEVAIDLARMDHAGSVVVAVLLVWARHCAQPLRLLALPDSLRRVLEFTGMDDLFDFPGAAKGAHH